ncbi:MAG TPA: elongation factor G [Bacillota bacterium]|nr:elongation factor G [Bacillota bacterium]HPU76379.1 elongation factor G [Bacillota bacterium]
MKKYRVDQLRNVAIISHGGAGKTTLAEAMLFLSGAVDRFGKVDDGTSTMDYDPDEVKRKISINASVAPVEWNGHKINLIDTPGYSDFVGEVVGALRIADATMVLVDAVSGVEVGTELTWRHADESKLPRMIVVNRMDRENANFEKALGSIRDIFGNHAVAAQLPIGEGDKFRGVADIIHMKAFVWNDASGKNVTESPIPDELADAALELREKLVEYAAESDEELLNKYLEGEELTQEEFERGLATGVADGSVVPVFCASGLRMVGVKPLMDSIVALLPSPVAHGAVTGRLPGSEDKAERRPHEAEPFSALVFKTMADPYVGKITMFRIYSGVVKSDSQVYNASKDRTERFGQVFLIKGKQQIAAAEVGAGDIAGVAKLSETTTGDTLSDKDKPVVLDPIRFPSPVLSMAARAKSKGDEDKIGQGLARLQEEDPTLRHTKEAETGELLVAGMGEVHLDIIAERLKRKFGAEMTLDTPKVPYRETIKGTVKVEGRHKKQTGGRGQFGHVWIEMSPLPTGSGFEFEDKVFGGAVPRQFIPAVEKGLREALPEGGSLAGFPLVDLRCSLYDGSSHPVDSSEMAFKIAAQLALKKGCQDANPIILEPIVRAEVTVPEEYMGDVMGDFNKKRGRILGMEPEGRYQVVRALVPMAEMFKYSIDLRSITAGRGTFTTEFDHYEEVPFSVAEKVIEQAKKDKEKES